MKLEPLFLPIVLLASIVTYTANRRLLVYTLVEVRPLIYTYFQANETFADEKLLEIWSDAWTSAGWDIGILNSQDAKQHPDYTEYETKLDRANIFSLTRSGYIRIIAMSTVKDGGYFSELHALPLHKEQVSSYFGESTIQKVTTLPNKGEMTFQDGAYGSIISGNEDQWNKMTKLLLENIQDNVMSSYRKIFDDVNDTNTNNQTTSIQFHLEEKEFLENVLNYKLDVCERVSTSNKSFIRLHGRDLQSYRNEVLNTRHKVEYRSHILENWWNFYKSLCWNENSNIRLGISRGIKFPKEKPLSFLDHADRTDIDTLPYLVIDNATISTVTCDEVSCVMKNACITEQATIRLFGNSTLLQIDSLQEKIKNIITHEWKCQGCTNKVTVEKGTIPSGGRISMWAKTATLSTGLSLHNCGHHIGDHIWPLIRLHLKFRDVDDVIQNGLGYLFLESNISPCDTLYHAIADQVIRYKTISTSSKKMMCFESVYVGTRNMKFMNDIPNSYFIPYDHFHRDMRAMRSLFWNRYGIIDYNNNNTIQPIIMDSIIITHKRMRSKEHKTHKYHNIANIPQLTKMIQSEFPTYQVKIVSWEDHTIQQQVSLMSRTKLMISLPGAAVINSFLFRDDSVLFCYCQRGEDDHRIDSSTVFAANNNGTSATRYQLSDDIKLWFDHFDYGKYYQICKEPDMHFSGQDTIIDVDALKERMHDLGL